jgi:hypothetical protein
VPHSALAMSFLGEVDQAISRQISSYSQFQVAKHDRSAQHGQSSPLGRRASTPQTTTHLKAISLRLVRYVGQNDSQKRATARPFEHRLLSWPVLGLRWEITYARAWGQRADDPHE